MTRALRRGNEAIRERLKRFARSEPGVTAAAAPAELQGGAPAETAVAEVAASDAPAEPLPHPFTGLTALDRIPLPAFHRDLTFLIALGIVLLIHLIALVASIRLGNVSPEDVAEQEKRGQVEKSETVTVELVEAPDAHAKTKLSQAGEAAPSAPPTPDAPAEQPTPPQPEKPTEAKEEKKPEPEPEKKAAAPPEPAEKPLTVEDFDVTMNEYTKAIERAQEERKRQKAQRSADATRQLGAAPQGKQSAYVKSVLELLARNKPQVYISRGEVYVQFVLTRQGTIGAIRVVESSHDPLLDQLALNAIKSVKFPVPPPNAPPDDLQYLIHFVMN